MSVDLIAAVRTVLLADATIDGFVGTRVVGEITDAEAKSMPRANIVLKPAGGPASGGYLQTGRVRVDVDCYAETLNASYLLSLAVYDVLHAMKRQKVGNVLIHSAEPSSKSSTLRDALKQWPVTYSSWLVMAAEIAAT